MATRKPTRGRPTTYNADTAALICERLASGEPITRICRDPAMPALQTHYRWIAAHPEYSEQYAHARDDQADTLAAEIMFIAALVRRPDTKTTPAGGGVKHRQSGSGSAPCRSPDRLAHVTGLKQ